MSTIRNIIEALRDYDADTTITKNQIFDLVSDPKSDVIEALGMVRAIKPLTYNIKDILSVEPNLYDPDKKINMEKQDASSIDITQDPNNTEILRFQSYTDLETLIVPGIPINIYVHGDTGFGKSSSIIDIAKIKGIPTIRVNLSYFTDVDDLMGGLRLSEGSTEFELGPVTKAMQEGCILLLDEIDAANPKVIMELQPVLEGKGVYVKKLNKIIFPTKGFQVIATGNTKGQGDATGKWVTNSILNRAFLERFAVYIEFKPPNKREIGQIISSLNTEIKPDLIGALCEFYDKVLSAKEKNVIQDVINVRRIKHILDMFRIFEVTSTKNDNLMKAFNFGISIFDDETQVALSNTWDVVNLPGEPGPPTSDRSNRDEDGDDIPF